MGLVRRALFGLVGVFAMLWLAAAPVAAIPPSFWFTINVSDCTTGAPIRAGVGVFSIQNLPAGAAAPLANGVIGPIGLGDYNFITFIRSRLPDRPLGPARDGHPDTDRNRQPVPAPRQARHREAGRHDVLDRHLLHLDRRGLRPDLRHHRHH